MSSDLQRRLLDAVGRCLRPIARLLMGAGINYLQFEEVAKRAFVERALGEPDARGRTTNTSRVAVRTGLSRKEVARIRQVLALPNGLGDLTFQIGRPARTLQLWHSEPQFLDEQGHPRDLFFDEDEPSFSSLIKLVGGDVPAGAVRAELLSAGGLLELPNGKLRALKRFFIPSGLDEDLIVGFAFIVAPLLETLQRNVSDPEHPLIQRVSYSDYLSPDFLTEFRKFGHNSAEDLVNHVDKWIAAHEAKSATMELSGKRVGVGVFYFEGFSPTRE